MSVQATEWLKLFRQEYLDTFIREGGSVVKVLVTDTDLRQSVGTAIANEATEAGFLVAKVDAAITRVHMIQEVFFAVARQINWDDIAADGVRRLLVAKGITVPKDVDLHNIQAIAAANGNETSPMYAEMKREIRARFKQSVDLAKEFRMADMVLAFAAISRDEEALKHSETVKSWLTNQPVNLVMLKALQIYQKIGRHNARLLLHSLARWIRRAGWSGLCIVLDLGALHVASQAQDSIRYGRVALLDAYELLRMFIDETDESAYLTVVAIADNGFADKGKRSIEEYNALNMRLVHDVAGQTRENPLTAMVRLIVG